MGFGVWGLGFGVWGLGFGLGSKSVRDHECRVRSENLGEDSDLTRFVKFREEPQLTRFVKFREEPQPVSIYGHGAWLHQDRS